MPDNNSQWEAHERERERRLARQPRCCRCRQHIQDDRAWKISGELWCESCAEEEFKVWTEDYIE